MEYGAAIRVLGRTNFDRDLSNLSDVYIVGSSKLLKISHLPNRILSGK